MDGVLTDRESDFEVVYKTAVCDSYLILTNGPPYCRLRQSIRDVF